MANKYTRCITINTDASFNQQHKVGGYAFYIVCDHFKIQKSGRFKKHPSSSNEAEMMCIANALYTLSVQPDLPETSLIIINSDALFVFNQVKKKSKSPVGRSTAKLLRTVKSKTAFRGVVDPKFEFRHVKAHNGVSDSRSWVNDWCDKEARKWMRYAVKNLNPIV